MLQRYFKPNIKTNEFILFSINENNIKNYELHPNFAAMEI